MNVTSGLAAIGSELSELLDVKSITSEVIASEVSVLSTVDSETIGPDGSELLAAMTSDIGASRPWESSVRSFVKSKPASLVFSDSSDSKLVASNDCYH